MSKSNQIFDLKLSQLSPVATYSFLQKFIGTIGNDTINSNLAKKLSIISRYSPDLHIFAHLDKSNKSHPCFIAIIRNSIDSSTFSGKLAAILEQMNDCDSLSEENDDVEFLSDLIHEAIESKYDHIQTVELISQKVNESILEDVKDQWNHDRITDFCKFEKVKFSQNGDFFVGTQDKYLNVDEYDSNGPEIKLKKIASLELAIAIHESIEMHQLKERILNSETKYLVAEHSEFCTNQLHLKTDLINEILATESSSLLLEASPVFKSLALSESITSATYFSDLIKEKTAITRLTSWDTLYSKLRKLNNKFNLEHGFNLLNVRDFNFSEIINSISKA